MGRKLSLHGLSNVHGVGNCVCLNRSEHTKRNPDSPSLKRTYVKNKLLFTVGVIHLISVVCAVQRLSQEMVVDSYEDFSLCLADCSELLKRKQKSPHRLCQFAVSFAFVF